MRYPEFLVWSLSFALVCMIPNSLPSYGAGEKYQLQMRFDCSGRKSSQKQKFLVVEYNGSKRAHSRTVYDAKIECGTEYKLLMDVFIATASDKRYQVRDGILYIKNGTKRQRVMVRERECKTYNESDWCSRTPDQLHKICRGIPTCEIEHSAYRCKREKQRCRRAQYEMHEVPKWEPFPPGFSPLPTGATLAQFAVVPESATRAPNSFMPVRPESPATQLGSWTQSPIGFLILGLIVTIIGGVVVNALSRR